MMPLDQVPDLCVPRACAGPARVADQSRASRAPRKLFPTSTRCPCWDLRADIDQAPLARFMALEVDRTEPAQPQEPDDPARIVAAGLVHLGRTGGGDPARLRPCQGKPCGQQAAGQRFRHRPASRPTISRPSRKGARASAIMPEWFSTVASDTICPSDRQCTTAVVDNETSSPAGYFLGHSSRSETGSACANLRSGRKSRNDRISEAGAGWVGAGAGQAGSLRRP